MKQIVSSKMGEFCWIAAKHDTLDLLIGKGWTELGRIMLTMLPSEVT